jgi:hypothetical protein
MSWAAGVFATGYPLAEMPALAGGVWADASIVQDCIVGEWKSGYVAPTGTASSESGEPKTKWREASSCGLVTWAERHMMLPLAEILRVARMLGVYVAGVAAVHVVRSCLPLMGAANGMFTRRRKSLTKLEHLVLGSANREGAMQLHPSVAHGMIHPTNQRSSDLEDA